MSSYKKYIFFITALLLGMGGLLFGGGMMIFLAFFVLGVPFLGYIKSLLMGFLMFLLWSLLPTIVFYGFLIYLIYSFKKKNSFKG